jgi:hypothetical protein
MTEVEDRYQGVMAPTEDVTVTLSKAFLVAGTVPSAEIDRLGCVQTRMIFMCESSASEGECKGGQFVWQRSRE